MIDVYIIFRENFDKLLEDESFREELINFRLGHIHTYTYMYSTFIVI